MGFFTFENLASHATDATRRDKAWDRAGKLRLVMRNRTILVAVLISPYFSQKEVGLGVRVSAGSTLFCSPEVGLSYHVKCVDQSAPSPKLTVSANRLVVHFETTVQVLFTRKCFDEDAGRLQHLIPQGSTATVNSLRF